MAGDSQNGFASDYNLIYTPTAAPLGSWSGVTFNTRAEWTYQLGLDSHSLAGATSAADPDFVDSVGGDYHVQAGSPAVDGGDPTMDFSNEPAPNGGRINIGRYGNTDEATQSPAELVQILAPNGLEKFEIGQEITITWRTDGLPAGRTANDGYEITVKNDGPVAYYRLNELSGTTALDSSGNALDGTYENGPTLGTEGIFVPLVDPSVTFDSNDDRVIVADDPLLRPDRLTVEAWVYPVAGIGSSDTVIAKTTNWNDGYGIRYSSGGLFFHVNDGGTGDGNYDAVYAPVTNEQWTHVVGTYDGAVLRIYTNGELISTLVVGVPINQSTAPLQIGHGSRAWTGRLDEVAIYDHVLTPEQIRAHFNRSPHTPCRRGLN